MLNAIKALLNPQTDNEAELVSAFKNQPMLAAAALMVEVMVADHEHDKIEIAALQRLLKKQFQLSDSAAVSLFEDAIQAHDSAIDYFAFTREINSQYSMAEKIQLIESLWQMAAADDDIQAVEQHVIRRIANLLHVAHSDFIAGKLKVSGD
ncbi:MAG: TerB family tellurite resistance protein [Methylophaga sp.]|nr:TerB family tellurite resistance protein [Methylophaga sp.]